MLFIIENSFSSARTLLLSPPVEARGVELRLDRFDKIDLTELKELCSLSPLPLLFTLRKETHGGSFTSGEDQRLKLIEQLFELKPSYFDLEHDTPPAFLKKIACAYPDTKIILSYHNFDETPELESFFRSMQRPDVFGFKLACRARSSLDALRMSVFVKKKAESSFNIAGISMGEHGEFARIIAPLVGNLFNFSVLEEKDALEGQLTASALQQIYHYSLLSRNSALFALIGDPVHSSISHLTHNQTLRSRDTDAVYVKIAVKPEELSCFLELARKLPFAGMSVTMPHKETILPLLDELSEDARASGAVNTLTLKKGTLRGDNTDGRGALDLLGAIEGKTMVILGAGGTARAVAYEGKKRGARVILVNRTKVRAEKAALELGCEGYGIENMEEIYKTGYDILLNATSAGMHPKQELLPIDPRWILPRCQVLDVVSAPEMTPFLKEAKRKGCSLIYGKELFHAQAFYQFKLWLQEQN